MKTQISRNSGNRRKRYSSVYQQQGRMLTDADWNELSDLVKERLNNALVDVIGSGLPKQRGLVELKDQDKKIKRLRWGSVYVDGIVAEVRPREEDPAKDDFVYTNQADLPPGREGFLPLADARDYIYYLDVWERTVSSLEDSNLRDAALHGADTCTRTQTMAQVKRSETSEAVDGLLSKGNAPLTLTVREPLTEPDPCDPCASEIGLDMEVGNYLFRVEVHDVKKDSDGNITTLTLKWSSENGAEQYEKKDDPPDYPKGFFDTNKWTYEYFNEAGEKHLGEHFVESGRENEFPVRGLLFHEAEPGGGVESYDKIRRWDGYCVLENSGGTWELTKGNDQNQNLAIATEVTRHGDVLLDDSLEIALNAINLVLELKSGEGEGKKINGFLVGDFWQAAVRERIHDKDTVLLEKQEPHGIDHHYLKIAKFEDEDGESEIVENYLWEENGGDEKARRFPFPRLTDLNSQDVGYSPACDAENAGINDRGMGSLIESDADIAWPLPDGKESSVRDIIDALLCDLRASHVPLDENDSACLLRKDSELENDPPLKTVQGALNLLCDWIRNLTADEIEAALPKCDGSTHNIRSYLEKNLDEAPLWQVPNEEGEFPTVAGILNTLLCQLNAGHIPVDIKDNPNACDELKESKTTLDALNKLCENKRRSCATHIIHKGDDLHERLSEIKDGQDASICFGVGDFIIDRHIVLENKGHIKISGAGPGTRIIAQKSEIAFMFIGCASVTLSDLTFESVVESVVVPEKPPPGFRPDGVVVATDCGPFYAERVKFQCSAGASAWRKACLLIRNWKEHVPEKYNATASIRDCEILIGHLQTGVVLVNTDQVNIENNNFKVNPVMGALTFAELIKEPQRFKALRDELISGVKVQRDVVRTGGLVIHKTGSYELSFRSTSTIEEIGNVIKEFPPSKEDLSSTPKMEAYSLRMVDFVTDNPQKVPSLEGKISTFKNAEWFKGETKRQVTRKLFVTGNPVVKVVKGVIQIKVGVFSVSFRSSLPEIFWLKIVKENPPIINVISEKAAKEYILNFGRSILLDHGFRKKYPEANNAYKKLKDEYKSVAHMGIKLVGGKPLNDIRVTQNFMEDILYGMKLVVQHSNRKYHLHFDESQEEVDARSQEIIKQISLDRQTKPFFKLTVTGHSDPMEPASNRLELSKKRAENVARKLGSIGIKIDPADITGREDKIPIVNNNTPEGRAENRRVEIVEKRNPAVEIPLGERFYVEMGTINANVMIHPESIEFKNQGYGIQCRNFKHLTIENNRVSMNKIVKSPNKIVRGIYVHGYFGFMLMVRQNLLENCKDGIIIDPKWDPKNPKRVRWMVVDNIAPLATRDVIAPGSVVNINNDFQM